MANKPVPTLVVGLGGSGSWTVVHIKRQLMDAYENRVPSNVALVALDTINMAQRSLPRIGSKDIEREEGSGVGGVSLKYSEYAYLGGDAHDLVEETATTNLNPHISSWLLADWKLRHAQSQLNLDEGAGMFRQLGRLALFRDLLNPATSKAKNVIENKFRNVGQDAGTDTSVSVMIVGSLVGGTGAGLFLDIAHIVRRIAADGDIPVIIRGFFFLPQAFRASLNVANLEMARQRSFAAMRELQRFTLHEDYKFGYPMHYVRETAGQDQKIYRSEVTQPLYDFVYFVDGEGPRRRMNNKDLRDGCASVVADSVVAFIDHHYGDAQKQTITNLNSVITARQQKTGRRAYVSSLGSYSIILPIQSIIEGWSYQLALETVHRLVPPVEGPEGVSQDKGYILKLSAQANPLRADLEPMGEVERILTSNVPIRDPHDPDGRRTLSPLPLWREAYSFYSEMKQNKQVAIHTLSTYNLERWLRILVPPMTEADPTIRRVMVETKSTLQETILDNVKPSDQRKPKGDPKQDYTGIERDSQRFIVRQLGQVESGGQRQGGDYGKALRQLAELQVSRFKDAMTAYVMNTLNGADAPDALSGKTGKLGWMLAVLQEMGRVFNSAFLLLEDVRTGGGNFNVVTARRQRVADSVDAASRSMRERSGESALVGRSQALKAQDAYLTQVQEYVDFYRTEFARDYVGYTFQQIERFIQAAMEDLEIWEQALAIHRDSLHNLLLDGSRRIQNEKRNAADVENHWIINDPEWEQDRFVEYLSMGGQDQRFLDQWKWDTQLVEDRRGNQVLTLTAQLAGQPLRKDMKGQWSTDNLNTLLEYSRRVFAGATRSHTVLGYLMSADTAVGPDGKRASFVDQPRRLAEFLHAQSGHQLSIRSGAEEMPTNTLLADFDPTGDPRQVDYLNQVIEHLGSMDGVGDMSKGQASQFHRIMQCDDRFRLTLLSTAEAIPIDFARAYLENQQDYMRLKWDMRQITHIFPAEVRAVKYEEQLPDLRQARRILHDKVSILFENEQRFRQFLTLLAYRVIDRLSEKVGTEHKTFWALQMPSTQRHRKGELEDYRLTESGANPSLLDAAFNYVLVQKDVRALQGTGMALELPTEAEVARYIDEQRRERTVQKIDEDDLALNDEELRIWLEHFMPPINEETREEDLSNWTDADEDAFLDIAELVVQYDTLEGLSSRLYGLLEKSQQQQKAMQQAQGNTADNGSDVRNTNIGQSDQVRAEAEYDLLSVSVLSLREQCGILKESVERRYKIKVGKDDFGLSDGDKSR